MYLAKHESVKFTEKKKESTKQRSAVTSDSTAVESGCVRFPCLKFETTESASLSTQIHF